MTTDIGATAMPATACKLAKPLAACVALALGVGTGHAAFARTIGVTNCADSGTGSLRAAIGDALDQDIVDLGGLSCSTITLTTGALFTTANNLTIAGRFQIPPTITIDGGGLDKHYNRVLLHIGTGRLTIENVAIANGKYLSAQLPHGGCIATNGGLTMFNAALANCMALSTDAGTPARGGAVDAVGSVIFSGVAAHNNSAVSAGKAYGGAVFAYGSLFASYSTFSGNEAISVGGAATAGGAIYAMVGDEVEIFSSTLSGNRATVGAALAIAALVVNGQSYSSVINSTIAGNVSGTGAAIHTHASLAVDSSTIAFNTTIGNNGYPAGLYGGGKRLQLTSTIAANNVVDGIDFDVDGLAPLTGSNNLIAAAANVSATPCARLAPLGDYGGHTQTIALLSGSPAIDAGIAVDNLQRDQRQLVRSVGAAPDIGAFELQPGELLDPLFRSTFDSRCE